MFIGLIDNASILITIIFITSQIFKNTGISVKSPIKIRILFGIIGGVSSILLIMKSINITDNIIIDYRHNINILVALFGGFIPAIITGLITAFFRLVYQGISHGSIIAFYGAMILSIGCGVISLCKSSTRLKIIILFIYCLIVRSIVFCLRFDDIKAAIPAITILWISSIIVGLVVWYFVQYLVTSNELINKLKKDSSTDFLTTLNNTRYFDLKYNQILREAIRNNHKVSLLIIDIDNFKSINDSHGHIAGDEVLRELGQLLLKSSIDIDFVSRIGGEEFTVILENVSKSDTVDVAERIRRLVESNIFILSNGTDLEITVSIGIAIYPDTVSNTIYLKEVADKKLYEAKHGGRNRVCI